MCDPPQVSPSLTDASAASLQDRLSTLSVPTEPTKKQKPHDLLTWKLTPTEEPSTLWDGSEYRGEILVRAHDEIEAREVAGGLLFRTLARRPENRPRENPWYRRQLVTCERIEDSRFESVSQPGVVLATRPPGTDADGN